MVGSGTALADDPELTCRLPGLMERSPLRLVVDGRLRLPLGSRLVATAKTTRTVLATVLGHKESALDRYRERGVEIVEAPKDAEGHPDIALVLTALGDLGLTRLLVEGGAGLAAALVRADLVDRLHWFRAPGLIGGDGLASIGEIGLDEVSRMARFERIGVHSAGDDAVETYRRKSQEHLTRL
jgi:diaminohydroxyphosphoribosylaminopyrimidine deaminase/5-amino-6-(5-phosphoribosylamino)uracil reductase